MKRRLDLARPRRRRPPPLGIHYDQESFGRFSEAIARNLGTSRFLIVQSVFVIIWIILNIALVTLRWDPYPFILLNLAFSTQAAYAAPLILLAQNRQEERDRSQSETDRAMAASTQADTEFLARELASVRMALASVVTTDELLEQIERLVKTIQQHGNSTN